MNRYSIEVGCNTRDASQILTQKFSRQLPRSPVHAVRPEVAKVIDTGKVQEARKHLSMTFSPDMLGSSCSRKNFKRSFDKSDVPQIDIMSRISAVGSALFSNYVHKEKEEYVFFSLLLF